MFSSVFYLSAIGFRQSGRFFARKIRTDDYFIVNRHHALLNVLGVPYDRKVYYFYHDLERQCACFEASSNDKGSSDTLTK